MNNFGKNYDYVRTVFNRDGLTVVQVGRSHRSARVEIAPYSGNIFSLTGREAMDLAAALVRAVHT